MATTPDTREVEILVNAQKANASIKEMGAGVALLTNQLQKMAADDPRRAALKRDFDVLSERVGAARKEMRTYAQTEEEVRLATERMNQENREVILNGQKLNSSFKDMKAASAQLEKQLESMNGDDAGRKKMLADYHALQDRIEGVGKEMKRATEGTSSLKQGFANAFAFATGGGLIALAGQIVGLGKDIFTTTAKFETYETVMTNALGDKSKAQQAMKDIQAMAAKTPFSVDELTGSFIKFVNRGLNPSMAEMTKMADLAASQGKSFDQLTEAVLDAGGGEFERLKEFGVKASKSGDQVSLSFKGVNQTVKNTPEAINGAIMAFGNMQGVAGSTAAISKTLEGQWSNLGDTAGQLEVTVGKGLRPMFTWLLGMFGNLLSWVGRFIEGAAPLKSLFVGIMDVFADLYHDIGEVLESLGLFSDKTDTVKMAVEVLRFALTVLLIPVKTLALAAHGIVETFIDWYNKSETLRGVLGGLGAVVVGLFTSIKDNAIKILGGVSDIIVGIFTLDKNRIIAGFKAAMNATADVMLEGGNQAAANFKKGYEANKDNHITHKVRIKTEKEGEEETGPAGEKLTSDKSGDDAAAAKKAEAAAKKAKAERDRRDREHLADLKRWVKDEGDILDQRDVLAGQREQVAFTVQGKQRQDQQDKVVEAAKKQFDKLTGLEADYTQQVAAIVTERDEQLRALQDKFAEQDEKQRLADIDKKIKDNEADTQLMLAELQNELANKFMNQASYEEFVYQTKQASMERELALLKQKNGEESAEYKKLLAEKLRDQAAHTTKAKALDNDSTKFKKNLSTFEKGLNDDGVKWLEESLDKQSMLYKAFKAVRKADAIANIGINLWDEIQEYSKSAAEMGPIAGPIYLAGMGTLAVVRAGMATAKVAGYYQGGATGSEGVQVPRPAAGAPSMVGLLGMATGMSVGTGGQLLDEQGRPVAGIVHKNEYVIPEWMRQDPQVLQVENWLEARRQRGSFYEGGPTTAGDARARVAQLDGAEQSQLVQVLTSLNERLARVEEWPTQLNVALDLLDLAKKQEKIKQVQSRSEIRPK
jgi:hypothetical protein